MRTQRTNLTRTPVLTCAALALLVLTGPASHTARAQDLDTQLIGQLSLAPGEAEMMVMSDGFAYCAMGRAGLAIIDVRNSENPLQLSRIGTGGYARSVAVSGSHAFLAVGNIGGAEPVDGEGLVVLDVSSPANPIWLSSTPTIGSAHSIVVSEDRALLWVSDSDATGELVEGEGLLVLDVSDPTNPVRVGKLEIINTVLGMAISGSFAYVAGYTWDEAEQDYWHGMTSVDISNPASPVIGSSREIADEEVHDMVISGDHAYVAAENLWIIDVGDPMNLVGIGHYPFEGGRNGPRGVAIAGDYVYVARSWWEESGLHHQSGEGLAILDVSDPSSPVRVGSRRVTGFAVDVAVSANHAYLAGGDLLVVDVTRANPQPLGWEQEGYASEDLATAGGYAFLGAGAGFRIIDIKDSTAPVQVGQYRSGVVSLSGSTGIAVVDDHVYMAAQGLEVVDISDPMSPVQIGSFRPDRWYDDVVVVGSHAYLVGGPWDSESQRVGLTIADISDPSAPVHIGSYNTGGRARVVTVSGDHAYLAIQDGSLQVIDVSRLPDPQEPLILYDTIGGVTGLALVGDYACVSTRQIRGRAAETRGGMELIDVSDPAVLRRVGIYDLDFPANDVAVGANHAYLTALDGLHVIDISDPSNPQRDGGNTFISPNKVAVRDNDILVSSPSLGLDVNPPIPGIAPGLIILDTFTELRIGPAIVEVDGHLQLPVIGKSGQRVRLQRSVNLIDWEDWQTMTLGGTGCGLIDNTTASPYRFYRVVEDEPTLLNE